MELSQSKRPKERALPTLENVLDYDYSIGTWSGLPNYGCPHQGCAFASLSSRDVAEHYFDQHLAKEA